MPSYEEICELAYSKWEQAGRPCGDGKEFWLQAESELTSSNSKSKSKTSTTDSMPLSKAAKKSTTK